MYEASASIIGRGFDSRHVHHHIQDRPAPALLPGDEIESGLGCDDGREMVSTVVMK